MLRGFRMVLIQDRVDFRVVRIEDDRVYRYEEKHSGAFVRAQSASHGPEDLLNRTPASDAEIE
jgi:hypothetical protein